jgi:hypothetical protein
MTVHCKSDRELRLSSSLSSDDGGGERARRKDLVRERARVSRPMGKSGEPKKTASTTLLNLHRFRFRFRFLFGFFFHLLSKSHFPLSRMNVKERRGNLYVLGENSCLAKFRCEMFKKVFNPEKSFQRIFEK